MADRESFRDAEAYAQALADLLPPGRAWSRAPGSVLMRLVAGLAAVWADVHRLARELVFREALPDRTLALLEEWERVAGLPDPCLVAPQTVPERRVALVNRLTMRGGQSRDYFLGLIEALGYEGVTITEYAPVMFGWSRFGSAGWRFGPAPIRFWWKISIPGERLTWFRFGSGMFGRDPHCRIARAEDIECIIRRLKPAHTDVVFSYTGV